LFVWNLKVIVTVDVARKCGFGKFINLITTCDIGIVILVVNVIFLLLNNFPLLGCFNIIFKFCFGFCSKFRLGRLMHFILSRAVNALGQSVFYVICPTQKSSWYFNE
jgi:hypothetical protein